MRDPVALLFADQNLACELVALGVLEEHLLEQTGGPLDIASGFLEQVEELAIPRS